MFMNPKDAPFAVSMMILMLGLVRLADEYPYPSPRTILILGLGAGFSIGCRILGVAWRSSMRWSASFPLLIEEYRKQGVREAVRRFAYVLYMLMPGPDARISDHGPDVAVVDHGSRPIPSRR